MNNDPMILPATDAAAKNGPGPVTGAGNRHCVAVADGPAFAEVLAAADEANDGTDTATGAGAGLSDGVQADRGTALRPAADGRREKPAAEKPHPAVLGAAIPDSRLEIPQIVACSAGPLKDRFGKAAHAPALTASVRRKGANPVRGAADGAASAGKPRRGDRAEGIRVLRRAGMVYGSGPAAGRAPRHQRHGVGVDRAAADRADARPAGPAGGPQRISSEGTTRKARPIGGRSHGFGVVAGPGAAGVAASAPAVETTRFAGPIGGRSHGSGVVAGPGAAGAVAPAPAVETTRFAGPIGGQSHGSGVVAGPGAAGAVAPAPAVETTRFAGPIGGRSHGFGVVADPGAAGAAASAPAVETTRSCRAYRRPIQWYRRRGRSGRRSGGPGFGGGWAGWKREPCGVDDGRVGGHGRRRTDGRGGRTGADRVIASIIDEFGASRSGPVAFSRTIEAIGGHGRQRRRRSGREEKGHGGPHVQRRHGTS